MVKKKATRPRTNKVEKRPGDVGPRSPTRAKCRVQLGFPKRGVFKRRRLDGPWRITGLSGIHSLADASLRKWQPDQAFSKAPETFNAARVRSAAG